MNATDPGDGGHCRDAALDELLAEQMLDTARLKDGVAKMVMPDTNRKAVTQACTVHAVSQCRMHLALKIDRSTVRYTSKLPEKAEGS